MENRVCYTGWTVPLPPPCVQVPTPDTSECEFLWRQGFQRGNYGKMQQLGWALIPYDLCPWEDVKTQTAHGQMEDHARTQGEGGIYKSRGGVSEETNAIDT